MLAPPTISVRFPKLFVGFLSEEPTLNENYVKIRVESEDAVCRTCELSPAQVEVIKACDFAYFAAIMAPSANERKFRTICDWGNWVFPYDDLFDNGAMRNKPERAMVAMNMLKASFFEGGKSEEELALQSDAEPLAKLIRFHASIWHSIESSASHDIKQRYTIAMEQYCSGTLAQVQQATISDLSSIHEVLLRRRQSVCVLPLFALVEFAQDIDLPDEVYNESTMEDIRTLGIDITMLHNDLLSYHKEESEGVPHNIVAAYRRDGRKAQEAVDLVRGEIEMRSLLLERAIEQVASWETPWRRECMRYVQGVRDVIKANLYWSFHSDRFLSDNQKIRLLTTDMVDVLAFPSDRYGTKATSTSQWPPDSSTDSKAHRTTLQTGTISDGKTVVPRDMEKTTVGSQVPEWIGTM